jgi:G3E family GTPase
VRCNRGDVPLEQILSVGGFDLSGKQHLLDEHGEHEQVHDRDISAVSIRIDQPLDRGMFVAWLHELVAMDGGDLLRYKGILHFRGTESRVILQGVHMIFELTDGGVWHDEQLPATELVFIGRRLMEDIIRAGVMGTIAR